MSLADRGAEFVPAREWMRICFELLDLLKAHKKGIRRAAVNSFGYIAKSLGPQDVLQVLLTNLRVQERQSRVCSTVAIAIVAETCGRECRPCACLNLADVLSPSLHMYPRHPERVSHSRAQRAHRLSEGTHVRLRVRRPAVGVLRGLGRDDARGRAHGPRPRAPADGERDREAPRARRRGPRVRGLDDAPHEPRVAELLRDVAARHRRGHGGHRGDARHARPRCAPQLCAAGSVPPRTESSRGECSHAVLSRRVADL